MTDSLTAISQRAESALWNALLPGVLTPSKPAAVAKQGGRKPTLSSAYRARLLELLKSLNDDEGQVSSQTILWFVERGGVGFQKRKGEGLVSSNCALASATPAAPTPRSPMICLVDAWRHTPILLSSLAIASSYPPGLFDVHQVCQA